MTWKDDLYELKKATETELRPFFCAWCTEEIPQARFFIRNIGNIQVEEGRHFRSGIRGQADVYGWIQGNSVSGYTRRALEFEIELKNIKTPQSQEQKAWAAFCRFFNIPYILLRAEKGETPYRVVERWAKETSAWIEELKKQ